MIGDHQGRRRRGFSPSHLEVDVRIPVSTEAVSAYVVGVPSLLTEVGGPDHLKFSKVISPLWSLGRPRQTPTRTPSG